MTRQRAPVLDFGTQWRAVLAEFFASLMLVFFGCMSCIPVKGLETFTGFVGALGFGIMTMCCIQTFGPISGSLLNPAITISAIICEKISVKLGVVYIVAECAGAIVGYGLLMILAPGDIAGQGVCVTASENVTDLQALGIEFMLTATLTLVTCSVFDSRNAHNTDSLPQKFGFTIIVLALAGSPLSGGGINPAKALGPAIWANRWDSHWVYWVGPMFGGILPAVLYKYVWIQPEKETDKSTSV